MLFELFLQKLGECGLSKAAKKTVDKAFGNFNNAKDFNPILKTLYKNLKSLSAKAADVDEEIKNGEASGRKKRKRQVEEWLGEVKIIEVEVGELESEVESQGFLIRLTDGGKAARLNEQVEKLLQQSESFGEPVLDVFGTRGEILPTDGMVGEAFNGYFETVLKLLEDRQVSKIGVYGMGGVGKTTLAKHIHNQLRQQSQGCVFWITVSDQEFTVKSLQNKIARYLGVDLSDEDEEAVRAGRLNRFLSQKKNSVLILDDVWKRIDMLKVGCTFSVDGCRLIITTRTLEVCHHIGCDKVIPVEKLGKDESWNLFKKTLGNEIQLYPRMEEVAKSMAKLCDGLPLGIVTMAGSMKGETSIDTWENALAELEDSCSSGRQNETEVGEVFRVLKYSFNRLNTTCQNQNNEFNTIQNCFMYCSLYPEDYEFGRDDLVREFISDGLLDRRKSGRAQVVQGRSILDKLVNVCLLETCVYPWNRECVKMHDLVRGMALEIGKKKYMGRAFDDSLKEVTDVEEWTEDLEKVALLWSDIEIIEDGISPNCPILSTLLLRYNRRLEAIPESFFSKLQGLCTLDLRSCFAITMLPNSISDLTSLKSLILEHCERLEKVPYLGKMKALRELNLSGTAIEEVPQGLEELLNLRFLSMNARGLKMLPRGVLLKLRHLQHLHLPLQLQVSMEEIENLRELEGFGGGVESVSDFNLFMKTHWVRGTRCYKIGVNAYDIDKSSTFVFVADMGCHENELLICSYDLKEEKVLGKGVMDLKISRCEGLSKWLVDDLCERFDNPTSLKRLKIDYCGGIEWIMRRSDGQGLSSTLEEIVLRGLDDLKGVAMMERGEIRIGAPAQPIVFSSLKSLHIISCNKVWKLGLAASSFPNLKRLKISLCGEIEEIFKENEGRAILTLPKLVELALSELSSLRKLGLATSMVPNLKRLRISLCGEIEEIFKENEGRATDSTLTLPKLEELALSELPRLRKVGLSTRGFPNLEEIKISGCGEIEEIFEEDLATLVLPLTLPKLRGLELCNMPRLKRVSKAAIISNSIEEISIRRCPRLESRLPLYFGGPAPPPSLKKIRVEREWWKSLDWGIHPYLPQLLLPFLTFK